LRLDDQTDEKFIFDGRRKFFRFGRSWISTKEKYSLLRNVKEKLKIDKDYMSRLADEKFIFDGRRKFFHFVHFKFFHFGRSWISTKEKYSLLRNVKEKLKIDKDYITPM